VAQHTRTILQVLLLVSALQRAPADELGLSGYILAPDGTPVSGGTVAIQSAVVPATTSIDRTGRFRYVPERPGTHRVVVSVPGFAPYRFSVTVPASRTVRLPVIHLAPATYFRVRFVSAAGEPLTAPQLRRRSLDARGIPIPDVPGDGVSNRIDGDGATTIGPLPRGITTLALDMPQLAQTRVPNVSVTGADTLIDGGTVIVQPGSVLHVDVVDGSGAPVPDHEVSLEDPLPMSPLVFPGRVRTNQQGRVTFDRLAAGRYRVRTAAAGRCGMETLSIARVVSVSGSGTVTTRLGVGDKATFRITSPLGPLRGILVSASPDSNPPQLPGRPMTFGASCGGRTDTDGRVTLATFPPGPARVTVHFANSTYVRRVEVPVGGRELAIVIPEGFLPLRVTNQLTNAPVAGASVAWTTGGGGRVEATTSATGDALLEGVGTTAGTLSTTARGYQPAEEMLSEPPALPHEVALSPAPGIITSLQPRVVTMSGEPLPDAVVQLSSANPIEVPYVAVTDAKGVVTFSDAPSGTLHLMASANGFMTSVMGIPEDGRAGVVLILSRGYRVIANVELPAAAGPQLVRVVNQAGARVEDLLDSASDRSIEPPGRISLGPLAPGSYVVELHDARTPRQERIRIVDRDVYVTFR
jgi:hypothetical protein